MTIISSDIYYDWINILHYPIVSFIINVKLAEDFFKDSEHPSIDTGFTGKLIIPFDIAVWVPSDIQATRLRLIKAPVSAPCVWRRINLYLYHTSFIYIEFIASTIFYHQQYFILIFDLAIIINQPLFALTPLMLLITRKWVVNIYEYILYLFIYFFILYFINSILFLYSLLNLRLGKTFLK